MHIHDLFMSNYFLKLFVYLPGQSRELFLSVLMTILLIYPNASHFGKLESEGERVLF